MTATTITTGTLRMTVSLNLTLSVKRTTMPVSTTMLVSTTVPVNTAAVSMTVPGNMNMTTERLFRAGRTMPVVVGVAEAEVLGEVVAVAVDAEAGTILEEGAKWRSQPGQVSLSDLLFTIKNTGIELTQH